MLWRWGGKRKKGLQLCLRNLNICIEKVDMKCWFAEMTLVMMSLPLARVFQCLFTFALVSPSRWLSEIWQLSRRGATGELKVEFKFQRRSCKLSFVFPPCRHSTPESLHAGYVTSPSFLLALPLLCSSCPFPVILSTPPSILSVKVISLVVHFSLSFHYLLINFQLVIFSTVAVVINLLVFCLNPGCSTRACG